MTHQSHGSWLADKMADLVSVLAILSHCIFASSWSHLQIMLCLIGVQTLRLCCFLYTQPSPDSTQVFTADHPTMHYVAVLVVLLFIFTSPTSRFYYKDLRHHCGSHCHSDGHNIVCSRQCLQYESKTQSTSCELGHHHKRHLIIGVSRSSELRQGRA